MDVSVPFRSASVSERTAVGQGTVDITAPDLDTPFFRVVSRLDVHKELRDRRGVVSGVRAFCPLCPGRGSGHDAGLVVTERPDGVVLVHCFRDCPTDAVLDELGLTWADLYPGGHAPAYRRATDAEPALLDWWTDVRARRWRGRGGDTELRVLSAMFALAWRFGRPDFTADTRTLAELAGVRRQSVSAAWRRLRSAGLAADAPDFAGMEPPAGVVVVRERVGSSVYAGKVNPHGTDWRLISGHKRPSLTSGIAWTTVVSENGAVVSKNAGGVSVALPVGPWGPGTAVWTNGTACVADPSGNAPAGRSDAFGGSARRVLAVLVDNAGATVGVLADLSGVDRRTVARALDRFRGHGLARRDAALPSGRGRPAERWTCSASLADLDAVAERHGWAAIVDGRRRGHAADRDQTTDAEHGERQTAPAALQPRLVVVDADDVAARVLDAGRSVPRGACGGRLAAAGT